MIALIRSGYFEDFDGQAAALWAVIYLVGVLLPLPIRKKRAQLLLTGVCCALVGMCELMAWLPTPAFLVGDGYAITQDAGLIGASFLVPFTAGMITALALSLLGKWLLTLIRRLSSR